MRGDVLSDAGEFGPFFDDAFDAAGREAAVIAVCARCAGVAGVVEEKGGEAVVAGGEIIAYPIGGGFVDEDGAIF